MKILTKLWMFLLLGTLLVILMCTTSCSNETTGTVTETETDLEEWDEVCCVHLFAEDSLFSIRDSTDYSWMLISSSKCQEALEQYSGEHHTAIVLYKNNNYLYVNKDRSIIKGDSFTIDLEKSNCSALICFEEYRKDGKFKHEVKDKR